jgi:hypothetical protein
MGSEGTEKMATTSSGPTQTRAEQTKTEKFYKKSTALPKR